MLRDHPHRPSLHLGADLLGHDPSSPTHKEAASNPRRFTIGRLFYGPLAARTTPTTRTAALILGGAATTALLALIPGPIPLLVAIAVLAGTVRGNLTLIGATAVTDRWGTADYGRLSATLAAPVTIAGALAPWASAALTPAAGSTAALFLWLAGLSLAAAALALASGRRAPRQAT